ncbi:MAG: hypothetical protein R3C40_03240 [Parvularculaceae bacterium]
MNRAARDQTDAVAKMVPAGRIGEDEDMAGCQFSSLRVPAIMLSATRWRLTAGLRIHR